MDVRLRPAPEIPVSLSVPRPVARVRSQAIDFGDVLFDTSPNFRLNEEAFITVDFSGKPFPLTAELVGDGCADLSVRGGRRADAPGADGGAAAAEQPGRGAARLLFRR